MTKQEEPKAIYWNLLVPLVVPRGQEGQFYGTQKGKVIQVVQPVHLYFLHSSGPAFFEAEPGDVIVRVNQPADKEERQLALSLTNREITHVAVAERFSDADALDTALRQSTKAIPKRLLGRRELIGGHFFMIPGRIDEVLKESEKQEIKGQYGGVNRRAKELRRIQIKIETGFRTAYKGLVKACVQLQQDELSPAQVAKFAISTWIYLVRVGSFKPYYTIVHGTPEVCALKTVLLDIEKDALLKLIARAIPRLEKGWRGFRVQPQEIRAARERLL